MPGKNVRPLAGHTLLEYTARAARESGVIDRIVLTTDSIEIAEAGRRAGLEVPFMRPATLAEDDTPMVPVITHAVGELARVRQLLTDNGVLFIDIVDFRAAYLRNWSVEAAVKIDHPYYLTEATMTAYLRRSGFDVLRTAYAADHLHISYVCRAGDSDGSALPSPQQVEALLREVRFVQNAPRGAGPTA